MQTEMSSKEIICQGEELFRLIPQRPPMVMIDPVSYTHLGAGHPLPELYVKAAMIARLYTFLQGKSGVHKELALLITELDVYKRQRVRFPNLHTKNHHSVLLHSKTTYFYLLP